MIEILVFCPRCKKQRKYHNYTANSIDQTLKRKVMCFKCEKLFSVERENIIKVVRLMKYGHK